VYGLIGIGLLLAIGYYIVLPIVVGRKIRVAAEPEFENVPPDDPRIPEAVHAFSQDVGAELAPLGFTPAAYVINTGTFAGMTGYITVFERASSRDVAAAMAVFGQATPAITTQNYTVEFGCEFVDDTELDTSNTDEIPGLPARRGHTVRRIPGMASLAELYRVHEATARHSGLARKPVPAPDQHAAALRRGALKDFRNAVDAGWMRLDANEQVYRNTLKGCLLSITRYLWPVATIGRAMMRRRARTQLRELGLPTDYATVDYKQRYMNLPTRGTAPAAEPPPGPPVAAPAMAAEEATCTGCGRSITDAYYLAKGRTLCATCGEDAQLRSTSGSRLSRAFGALVLGGLASVLAAVFYFAVAVWTNHEIGWIALLTGLLVGGAVWLGSRCRGGRRYQVLAILMTYCAMGLSYTLLVVREYMEDPEAFEQRVLEGEDEPALGDASHEPSPFGEDDSTVESAEADEQTESQPTSAASADDEPLTATEILLVLASVIMLMFVLPVILAIESPSVILFVGIALWEAWRINKRRPPDVNGPYPVGEGPR
jgi:hypothetical protein